MTLPVEAFGHFEPTNDVAMRQRLTIEAHAVMITTTVTIGGRSGCAMQYARCVTRIASRVLRSTRIAQRASASDHTAIIQRAEQQNYPPDQNQRHTEQHERAMTGMQRRSARGIGIVVALAVVVACDGGVEAASRDEGSSVSQAVASDPMTLPPEAFGLFEATNDAAVRRRLTIEAHAVMITTTVMIGGQSAVPSLCRGTPSLMGADLSVALSCQDQSVPYRLTYRQDHGDWVVRENDSAPMIFVPHREPSAPATDARLRDRDAVSPTRQSTVDIAECAFVADRDIALAFTTPSAGLDASGFQRAASPMAKRLFSRCLEQRRRR